MSLVLAAQGDKVAESRHLPYGGERWRWPEDGTFPIDYRFTGQRWEQPLGIYIMGARWYDPALGRWLSADTLVPEPGNPQALNRYSYVGGNPLRCLDPTGHSKFTDWLIETGKKIGNSGPIGKALVVSAAEAVNHVNQQTEKVFYPDENTDPVDRFWACVEIGGGATLAAAPVAYGGSLAIGAIGGGSALAETGGAAATAACADGDCTNEIRAAGQAAQQGLSTFSRAAEFGIRSYNELRGAIRGTGPRAHHIIDQRFADRFGLNPGQMRSVALTPELHQVFTNAWRNAISYINSSNRISTVRQLPYRIFGWPLNESMPISLNFWKRLDRLCLAIRGLQ